MNNTKFWNDAAIYGAYLGIAEILFGALNTWKNSAIISLLGLVVFVVMLHFFTRRRVMLYGNGDEGYGYGKCLKFIVAMSIFAGVLVGAYSIVASHFLFEERYHEIINTTIGTFAKSGLYTDAMLEQVKALYEKLFFSPIYVVVVNIISYIIKGTFFGLFVAAFTRREANIFAGNDKSDNE